MFRVMLVSLAAAASLSACTGSRIGDSALIGAGAGAVAGEVISGDPVAGAVIGGAGGAVIGATRDKDDR